VAGSIVLIGVGLWIVLQTTYGPLASKLGFSSSNTTPTPSGTTTGGTAAATTGTSTAETIPPITSLKGTVT
jgi:hypothetical protein